MDTIKSASAFRDLERNCTFRNNYGHVELESVRFIYIQISSVSYVKSSPNVVHEFTSDAYQGTCLGMRSPITHNLIGWEHAVFGLALWVDSYQHLLLSLSHVKISLIEAICWVANTNIHLLPTKTCVKSSMWHTILSTYTKWQCSFAEVTGIVQCQVMWELDYEVKYSAVSCAEVISRLG